MKEKVGYVAKSEIMKYAKFKVAELAGNVAKLAVMAAICSLPMLGLSSRAAENDALYCVIDLSGGADAKSYPISYLDAVPTDGWTDEYKTTKLVLRRIEAGTFKMQNIQDVTITKPFYMGVFEVTQKQYELVTGTNPTLQLENFEMWWMDLMICFPGENRPVNVSWNMVRGSSDTNNWPTVTSVDKDSFVGRIRARTGLTVDLPTEAQWEYACRAGTNTEYNKGDGTDALVRAGRFYQNAFTYVGGYMGHTAVGSYEPNDWGLYDMHGNVAEWCLDWYGNLTYGTDPEGSISGGGRIYRGGGWSLTYSKCTSTRRDGIAASTFYDTIGFRLAGDVTVAANGSSGESSSGQGQVESLHIKGLSINSERTSTGAGSSGGLGTMDAPANPERIVTLTVAVTMASGDVNPESFVVMHSSTLGGETERIEPTSATLNEDGTVTLVVSIPDGASGFMRVQTK